MSMLVGDCRTCGTTIKLDIGSRSVQDVVDEYAKKDSFHCPGRHVELSAPHPHHWQLDKWELTEGCAPTDEEWLSQLNETYPEVLSSDKLHQQYEVQSFCLGCCIAVHRESRKKANFDFAHAPKSRQRFYYRIS